MAIRRAFVWGTDDTFGQSGWMPKGIEGDVYAVTEGRMVAHDALEHMPGSYSHCAATDECVAIGAALFIRGEQGRLRDPVQDIASDIASILRDHGTRPVLTPAKYRPGFVGTWIDRDGLDAIKAQALSDIQNDYDDAFEDAVGSVADCLAWVVYGYRKAARRWGNDSWRAVCAFDAVADWVDRRRGGDDEGTEFHVSVSIARRSVGFWVGYPGGYGDEAAELDSGFSRF